MRQLPDTEQHLVGDGTGTQALGVPIGATIAHISADGGDVRYSFAVGGAPDLTDNETGTLLADGKERYLFDDLSNFVFDALAGTVLHVHYFKE